MKNIYNSAVWFVLFFFSLYHQVTAILNHFEFTLRVNDRVLYSGSNF